MKSLVEKLGGQSLYGSADFRNQLLVVIRELLQNAKDAINARASIDADVVPEILVRLEEFADRYFLTVQDTGCGMSKRVLTGPLLDFGSSFWTSDLVSEELPGLKGKGFKSAGKFGVGFYSTFMVANSVKITSRRYNEALAHSNQLKFKDGLSLRPMLVNGVNLGSMKYSTEVCLEISKERKNIGFDFPFGPSYFGVIPPKVGLAEAIEHIANFSGIPIRYQHNQLEERKLNSAGYNPSLKRNEWLTQVSGHSDINGLDKNQFNILAQNLRLIDIADPSLGFAALSPYRSAFGSGARTVGGLRANLTGGDETFFGFIDCHPDSAKRNPAKYRATKEQLNSWVTEQIQLLQKSPLDQPSTYVLASRLASFYVDPTPYLILPIASKAKKIEFFDLAAILNMLCTGELFVAVEYAMDMFAEERDLQSLAQYPRITDYMGAWRVFSSQNIHNTSPPDPQTPDTTLKGVIDRALLQRDMKLQMDDTFPSIVSSRFNLPVKLKRLTATKIS